MIGRLEIPRIGLSTMVLEGVDNQTLWLAAGHIPSTPLPGQPGNVAIAAHRDTFFRRLSEVRRNDVVSVTTANGTHRYRVDSLEIVAPTNTRVLEASPENKLTLLTCYPFTYMGHAPKRYVISASEISDLDHTN